MLGSDFSRWLERRGYERNTASGIFYGKDAAFRYSDGDEAEDRIARAIAAAKDRSVFSAELLGQITDWPSEYHLSRSRHCLLRPLGIAPGTTILEIGAGCGAITRYLGECGAQVLALEGSRRRAEIAAARCDGLANVTVLAGNLLTDDLPTQRFDWVLMVGVLEYASVYGAGSDAASTYVRRAAACLADGGQLAVAIENKLGLKYFNGLDEDHVGKPFYGIQGLYREGEPRTFGRAELQSLLEGQGLGRPRFWYPFPDYKLPQVMLSEEGLTDPEFLASEALAKIYARNYSGGDRRNFLDPLALRELEANGILGDLSNSFLAVASRTQGAPNDVLASSYAVNRRPEFATETTIVRQGDELRIEKRHLFELPRPTYHHPDLALDQLVATEAYQSGPLAMWRVTEQRARGGSAADVAVALGYWFSYLLGHSRRRPGEASSERSLEGLWIGGEYQDCTPFNLIEGRSGPAFIDREWRVAGEIPLGWVVTRSVTSLLVNFPGCEAVPLQVGQVVGEICAQSGLSVEMSSLSAWSALEEQHQRRVSGDSAAALGPNTTSRPINTDPVAIRPEALEEARTAAASALKEQTRELETLREQMRRQQSADAETRRLLEQRESSIDDLTEEVNRLTSEISSLFDQMRASEAAPKAKSQTGAVRRAYGKLYRIGGSVVRRTLPRNVVLKLRSLVPNPMGVPMHLMEQSVTLPSAARRAFSEVSARQDQPDVFILSIIDWTFRYQRPQHLASGLAEKHRVFFVEMELSADGISIREVSPNLFVVRLPKSGIGHIPSYRGKPTKKQVSQWLAELFAFCDGVQATAEKHIIIEHPFWWQFARHLPPEFQLVVDCMDDIGGFANTEPFLLGLEDEMLAACDKLIVSSQYLFDKWSRVHPAAIIRNGADLAHFSRSLEPRQMPAFMKGPRLEATPPIKVGYVGAIAEWFDVDLLEAVANAEPGIEFHLCGSVSAIAPLRLEQVPNVRMYGEVSYADVPAFLESVDVAIIPFQLVPIIKACDPVKFYEYCAVGKPTVSTRLPELERAADLVFFADGPREFAAQIHAAYRRGKDAEFRAQLLAYATDNVWQKRTGNVEAVIGSAPMVSVIMLSYGDAGFTQAALASLFEAGMTYHNLEVIVVDNGSAPAELERVRAACRDYPQVTLIENGINLGFAKGNNVGIAAARGEFILLLNNDTYVAPGAIAGMVRHLQREPSIGVVGPLTNNIGNEARLPIAYSNMDEMKAAARRSTTGFRNQWTPLPVVAYFAAMFRRADLEQFGPLSEDYGRGMFEDDDHCRVIRSHGYQCALAEDCFVHHHLSASFDTAMSAATKEALFESNRAVFEGKWGPWTPHRFRDQRPPSSLVSKLPSP